jgi:hypothetical protein
MLTPTSEILRVLKEKNTGIRSGTESILAILQSLHKQVLDKLGDAAISGWDRHSLKQMLGSIDHQISNFSEKAKREASGQLEDLWGMGQVLVDAPLKASGIYTGFHLSTSGLDVLKDFTFHKLDELSDIAWNKIKGELTMCIMGGKTPQQVAGAIGKNLKSPSIFKTVAERAEVITQTEMGRAFSQSAQYRMHQASQYVPELQKEWMHSGHPKQPRPAHLAANGQHVQVKNAFNIGGVPMMYPRDPAAPIEEVIRCGCDHVPYHRSWANN